MISKKDLSRRIAKLENYIEAILEHPGIELLAETTPEKQTVTVKKVKK